MKTQTQRAFLVLIVAGILGVGDLHAQNKVGTSAATFLNAGIDARGAALGNAQVAQANRVSALLWNPAGISQLPAHAVAFTHGEWFLDSRLQHLGIVVNGGRNGNIGISVTALSYGEIEVTRIDAPMGTGEIFSPMDLAIGLSYARNLTDRFALGGTGKFIRQQIWNSSANGFAVDVGVYYQTDFRNMRIGMAITNFGTDMRMGGKDLRVAHDIDPNRSGNNDRLPANMETDAWPLPLNFRVGLAMDLLDSGMNRATLAVDAQQPNDQSESANIGLEYAFRDLIFLRGGYRQAFAAVREDGGFTLGFGIEYEFTRRVTGRFDYAWQQYQDGRLGSPQMLTFEMTF
jgi:opacity protein-like surface antigen